MFAKEDLIGVFVAFRSVFLWWRKNVIFFVIFLGGKKKDVYLDWIKILTINVTNDYEKFN